MIRRFGDAPKRGQHYTRRPGVYAILLRDGQILVTYQASPVPEIQLPGGGIDPGEHLIPALHREVIEETGWRIDVQCRFGMFRRFTYMPDYELWAEKLCTIFIARPVLRLGPPTEPGHSALWMPATAAMAQLGNPGDRAMLSRALGYPLK